VKRIIVAATLSVALAGGPHALLSQSSSAAAPADASPAAPARSSSPNILPAATSATPSGGASTAVPDKIILGEGVDVPLKFGQDLSSKTAVDGDPVIFVLDQDIKVGDVIVAKAGSKAFGEVTNAHKSGMMGKPGDLNIRLDYLKTGDDKIRLRGTKAKEGENATTSTIVLTVLFGPIGLIKHGKNIDIKQGTQLTAYVSDDITLPPAK
jgi:hypothetical protein